MTVRGCPIAPSQIAAAALVTSTPKARTVPIATVLRDCLDERVLGLGWEEGPRGPD